MMIRATVLLVVLLLIPAQGRAQDTRPLGQGQKIERELRGADTHAYNIALRAGEFLRVTVEQRGVDIELRLRSPAGVEIVKVNFLDDPTIEQISYEVAEAGNFSLEIKAVTATAPSGRYTVLISIGASATPQDRERVAAERLLMEVIVLWQAGKPEKQRKAIAKSEQNIAQWRKLEDIYWLAYALNLRGMLHNDLGERAKALDYYRQALSLRRSVGDRHGEARTLSNIGFIYKAQGKSQKALEYFNQSLLLRRTTGNRFGEADTLTNIGHFYNELGKPQKALEYYTKTLPLHRSLDDRLGEANTFLKIGNMYGALREQQKALDNYNEALRLFNEAGDRNREADTLNNIGTVYYALEERPKSLDYYTRALSLYKTIANPSGEADTLVNAGHALTALGERKKALDYYLRALSLYKSIGDQKNEALTLIDISKSYYESGERWKALDNLNQALSLNRLAGERGGEANTLRILADVYKSLGEKQKAIDFYDQALLPYIDIGNRRAAIQVLEKIGEIYLALGNMRKAIVYFQKTLPLWKGLGDRSGEANKVFDIGLYYSEMGEQQKALKYFNQALSLYKTMSDREGEAHTLTEIGRAYNDLGNAQKASSYYERTLAISRDIGYNRQQAVALTDIGSLNSRLGKKQQAIEYYEKSLAFWRAVGDKQGEALTLANIGFDYQSLGDKQKALDYQNLALPLFQLVKDSKGEIKTLNEIVDINLSFGDKQKSLEAYQQIARLQKASGDRQGEAKTLSDISNIYYGLDDFQNELKTGLELLSLWQTIGNRRREAAILNNIGLTYNSLENYQASLEYHQRALPLWRELKDRRSVAETLVYIGARYFASGDKKNSLAPFEQALTLYRAMANHEKKGATISTLGITYYLLGEKQKAWEYFDQALPLLKYPGSRALISELLIKGGVFLWLEDYQRALEFYRQVIVVSRRIGNRELRAASLTTAGKIYSIIDDYPNALNYFQQAWSLYQAMGDRNGEAAVLNDIGEVYTSARPPQHSPTQPQRAENNNQALELAWMATEVQRLEAAVQQIKANAHRAKKFFRQSLLIYQANKNRTGEAKTLLNIGIAHHILDDDQEALNYYQKALFLTEETSDSQVEMMVLYRLMKVWTDLSNPRLAIFYGKRAINLLQGLHAGISKLDKGMAKTFLHLTEDPYRELASLLIGQGRIAEAEQVLAMLKEEEYFEYVRRDDKVAEGLLKRANLSQEEEAALKRYKEKAEELTRLGREYGALETERSKLKHNQPFNKQARLDELDRLLADARETLRLFLNDLKAEFGKDNVRVKEIESSLQKDLKAWGDEHVAAIFTIVGKDNLSIVVMTADAQHPHTISISAAKLNGLISDFRAAVKDPAVDPRPSAQKLYDVLVKPIEKDLIGIEAQTLLWSLDGALRYVPIAALYDAKQGYLAERYANVIITLASRTNLGLQTTIKERWQVLGLGVSKEYETFKALTEVREELRGIVRERAAETAQGQAEIGVLDGHRLLDEEFTFTAFKNNLGRYPFVHIASHFSFQPGRETDSFLLLGGGNERKLTIDKIRKGNTMFNGVELLTLSACDTAVGGVKANGEEVESFGLLAQEQGARSVMATLWQVADPSTRELMVKFYQLYSATANITKAEALRRAQLVLLNGGQQTSDTIPPRAELAGGQENKPTMPSFTADPQKPYAHPYYWAPFILIGNWR